MKKSSIFMTAGTLILAITAIFATKANKKFTTVATAYWHTGTDYYYLHDISSSILTTVKGSGIQLSGCVYTLTGGVSTPVTKGALFTKTSHHDVYFK